MNRLVYETEGKKVEVALSGRPVSFGRGDEADHQLPTKLASRIHAQVFPRDRGWWVEDLASSNGTLVNGNKILKPMPLVPGDVITVGDVQLKYEGEAAQQKGAPDHLIARIVYSAEKGKAPIETLIRDRITIGRKPDNSLQIDHKVVSGHHCEIINRQGAYLMRDLGSSNGTFIQKKRVTEHTLRNGDVIVLGKKISVYFIDPAGAASAEPASAPQQAAPVGAPPPKTVPKAASSAAGASDRGSFEPIPAMAAKRPVNPLPHIGIGLGLGLLFLLAGWLLGDVLGGLSSLPDDDPNVRKPDAALSDAAMSFEGPIDDLGNPEGWTASFEAKGKANAELLADSRDPFDGQRSLSVTTANVDGASTLVLQTTQARKLDLGSAFQLSIAMKGEGANKLAIALSALDEKGSVISLAAGSFVGVKGTSWTQFTVNGTMLNPPPESAQLRLLIAGTFSRLWIDRIELSKTADDRSTRPFQGMDAPNLAMAFDRSANARLLVRGPAGREVSMQPVLLNFSDRHQSEDELWALNKVLPEKLTWTALLAAQGDAAAVNLRAIGYDNRYFIDHGLQLKWDLAQGTGVTLAMHVVIPMPPGATIALADRRGYPMVLDARAIHAYAYSTISELMVNESGISLSFPRGAVAWFDLSRSGELHVTLRAADKDRRTMDIDVNSRPLMFARLYDRLFNEASRMLEANHYSAAEVRYAWLANPRRQDSDLAVMAKAQAKLDEIKDYRDDLSARLETAWLAAQSGRSTQTVKAARNLVDQYINRFPGDTLKIEELNKRRETLETWEAELAAVKKTPEEMKAAEDSAKALYADADKSFKAGNYLMALVLLDTIARDYSDTSQLNNANALRAEIDKKLQSPTEQNKQIDEELKRIDEDIKFKDYNKARDRCLELFKRFPNTPRNRDIMQRVRAIEDAFDD